MKDLVIVFLLALAIGAALNSWESLPDKTSDAPLDRASDKTPGRTSDGATDKALDKMSVATAPLPGDGAASSALKKVLVSQVDDVITENSDIPMLDETGFDRDVIKSATPVLVFFCDNSEPCREIWPTVQSVANKVADDYRVVRVDINKYPTLAQEYLVSGTPTFMVFQDGRRIKQLSGVFAEQDILSFLKQPKTASLGLNNM